MKGKIILTALILLVLAGCSGPSQPSFQATIEVLESRLETVTTINTNISPTAAFPSSTSAHTPTQEATSTIIPTRTSTSEPTVDISRVKAKNYIDSDESNGIIVEVERIVISDQGWINNEKENYLLDDFYLDKPTLIEFRFRITNNTNKIVRFNFYTTIASANGEQIKFSDYMYEVTWDWGGDDLDSDILPGSTVRGYLWTGVKRSKWDEIKIILISIDHAFDKDYSRVTKDFLFTIEVSDWGFEPLNQ